MALEKILPELPTQPTNDYWTKHQRGITFKFKTPNNYWITLQVTGCEGNELPSEVATALATWSLDVLASRTLNPVRDGKPARTMPSKEEICLSPRK